MPDKSILEDTAARLTEIKERIRVGQELIKLLKDAGEDVTEQTKQLKSQEARLAKWTTALNKRGVKV